MHTNSEEEGERGLDSSSSNKQSQQRCSTTLECKRNGKRKNIEDYSEAPSFVCFLIKRRKSTRPTAKAIKPTATETK
jgi:hypothetical protein